MTHSSGTLLIEKDRRGVRGASLVAVLFSAGREQQFVPRARRIYDNACTGKIRQTKEPKHSTSTACSFPGGITRKEPRHELLEHGARSPRGSREGLSGSDSKGVCWSMGSLSKRSPRQRSFEGLIPVCLSVACRAYMPQSPKAQNKYKSMADLGACAGNSRRCAVQHAGRARSKQV